MASNSFGTIFRITTWGESHGKAIGCVIDGCPACIELSVDEINEALSKRAPGGSALVSPRKESDCVEILSGVFEGKTTGAPISLLIHNHDVDSSKYEPIKELFRPGHANYTYLNKYGIFDYRGGGRASARETAARVAAGAIAQKILDRAGITVTSFLQQVGTVELQDYCQDNLAMLVDESSLFCPDKCTEEKMVAQILQAKETGDSLGGVVACIAQGMPIGLGEPIYDKITARLAYAMLGLPASRGFEIGDGFSASYMLGSEHNDGYEIRKGVTHLTTNHSGGVLGGITTGEDLFFKVAFKPTSSIMKAQKTTTFKNSDAVFSLPAGSRHDPCVAVRAVAVVQAMCRLVLADAYLFAQSAR